VFTDDNWSLSDSQKALRLMKQLFFSELHALINNLARRVQPETRGCLFATFY
jgi:hypothetical protein